MSGKVPLTEMTQGRRDLLEKAIEKYKGMEESEDKDLLFALIVAAEICPRTTCAFCEHIARSEAQQQSKSEVGEAEAG
jgi:uncharacterized protein YutE (UPF0331/DUF86 family)